MGKHSHRDEEYRQRLLEVLKKYVEEDYGPVKWVGYPDQITFTPGSDYCGEGTCGEWCGWRITGPYAPLYFEPDKPAEYAVDAHGVRYVSRPFEPGVGSLKEYELTLEPEEFGDFMRELTKD